MTQIVTQLFIYPVKSCRGIELNKVEIRKHGFLFDRLWALTSEDMKFVTGGPNPKLLTITQSLYEDPCKGNKVYIKLEAEENEKPLFLDPYPETLGPELEVTTWKDKVIGTDCGDEVGVWFTRVLGMKVRLILKGKHPRKVDDIYLKRDGLGHVQSEAAFSVGFPILMTSEESLESLRKELPEDVRDTIGMKNFRTNLVIRGCSKPYEEDEFGIIDIEGVKFHCDAPCGRCVFINHDPESKDPTITKHEPLKTLMRIRRNYPHIYKYNPFFGIYLIPLENGTIEVGQSIKIISRTKKTEVKEDAE